MDSVRQGVVCFSHGKESGPQGFKIQRLSKLVIEKGMSVISVDYRGIADPIKRVEKLLNILAADNRKPLILVGSSMGAFVSIIASQSLKPAGLFLMAPAVYLKGYAYPDITPVAEIVEVVHGRQDEIVPVGNALKYCKEFALPLHILDSGHSLNEKIKEVENIFINFLNRFN